mgnify:CR=1 FL=1
MVAECLILGSSAVALKDAITIEYLKSKQFELSEQEKQEILSDKDRKFIHFTSEKSAKEIMKSGFLMPTKGVIKNHFTKEVDENGKKRNSEMIYMFDSQNFNVNDYIRNLPRKNSPYAGIYEYYAVSMTPNEYNINSFKKRAQDGAITYDGRLDISYTDTKLSKYVIDLDENNEYTMREIDFYEEYEPSPELLEKINKDKKTSQLGYVMKSYLLDVKKAKGTIKEYRSKRKEHNEQIKKKIDFAKANKQFKKEQEDKNYIYEKDGKTIVVKSMGFKKVDGKLLQQISIIGNGYSDQNESLESSLKFCYTDQYDLNTIEPEVASQYFFNNYENMLQSKTNEKYIGMPVKVLEDGSVINEYDENFNSHYKRKQAAKEYTDKYIEENKKSFFSNIKNFFGNLANRFKKNELKLLSAADENRNVEQYSGGYSSAEQFNRYDPNIEILEELQEQTCTIEEISENQLLREEIEVQRDSLVKENPDDIVV